MASVGVAPTYPWPEGSAAMSALAWTMAERLEPSASSAAAVTGSETEDLKESENACQCAGEVGGYW